MATLNFATREITARIVYFGAPGAGSNTNLERLYARIDGRSKSALHRLGRDGDERSLYFDYVSRESGLAATPTPAARAPVGGPGANGLGAAAAGEADGASGPSGLESFALALAVYSLPGGVALPAHRDEVLREVDGVVFVADARGERNPANVEALLELETLLRALGLEMSDLPVVVQVNHTDAADARPVADAVFDLNPFGFPVHSAVARQDVGVLETHAEVARAITTRIGNALVGATPGLRVVAVFDPVRLSDVDVIRAHDESIHRNAAEAPPADMAPERTDPPAPAPVEDGEPVAVEVPFQPRELVGSHPVEVLAAELEGDQVRIELVMARMGGGASRRLTVRLANRPADSVPIRRASSASPVDGQASASAPTSADSVFDYLPDMDDPAEDEPEEPPADLPGVAYGMVGAVSGVVIGVLVSYLLAPTLMALTRALAPPP